METLSKGFKKPEAGLDTGDAWFQALADNIQQLNDHTHNGTNSQSIPGVTATIALTSVAISTSGWTGPDSEGNYTKAVVPGGSFDYTTSIIQITRDSDGEVVYAGLKQGATVASFVVKTNDISGALTAKIIG